MSRIDWICLGLLLLGVMLFLFGANYYNEVIGWIGFVLFIISIAVLVFMFVYNWTKKKSGS
ncbi:MAG: hypothetical protein GX638_01035 [Crenarchaeota archaeon]|nr:hypothetical protein [Thermoproteota archaeon]